MANFSTTSSVDSFFFFFSFFFCFVFFVFCFFCVLFFFFEKAALLSGWPFKGQNHSILSIRISRLNEWISKLTFNVLIK